MSQTAKKPVLKFSPEVQSLLDNSNTHPVVLMFKLATDNLVHSYDAEALALRGERERLMARVLAVVTTPTKSKTLDIYGMYQAGMEITLKVDYSMPCMNTSINSHTLLADMFKSMDSYAPKSSTSGFRRVMSLSIFKKGPALCLAAHHHLFQGCSSVSDDLRKLLEGSSLTPARMRFGACDNSIKLQLKGVKPEDGKVSGGYLHVYLENVVPGLADELLALGKKEQELLFRIYSDLRLLANKSAKVRKLDVIMRRMPDLLEHPELKMLLGYNVNPQEERIKSVVEALTGATFLKPIEA